MPIANNGAGTKTSTATSSSAVNWCVYMLVCADGTLYTGMTNDLDARIAVHNSGKGARYTRSRLPVRLVYSEPATDRGSAASREAQLKSLSRSEKLALIPTTT